VARSYEASEALYIPIDQGFSMERFFMESEGGLRSLDLARLVGPLGFLRAKSDTQVLRFWQAGPMLPSSRSTVETEERP